MNPFVIPLALAAALGNLAYWFWVMTRGLVRFRDWVSARYGVVITRNMRGHWEVGLEGGSAWRRLGIEMLQFAYLMGAFAVWSVLLCATVLLLSLVSR